MKPLRHLAPPASLFFALLASCAQELSITEEHASRHSSFIEKSPYLSCNVFADETFRGRVWNEDSSSDLNESCVYLEIEESPQELLENRNLFLQLYPFLVESGGGFHYGPSLPINTIPRQEKSQPEKEALIQSQIIDAYLVNIQLETSPDQFFFDHFFEICNIDDRWEGLQLVIYSKKENIRDPKPLRTTKFLLPPFLAHPEAFKNKHGNGLTAFHPFLEMTADQEKGPEVYYGRAEQICGA